MAKRKRGSRGTSSRRASPRREPPAPAPSVESREPTPRASSRGPGSRSRRRIAAAGGIALTAATIAAYVMLSRGASDRAPPASPTVAAVGDARTPSPAPTAAAPRAAPAATYIGSEACADCHDEEYARWKRDWHARALAVATPKAVVGNFANAHYAGSSSEAWMARKRGAPTMRTRGPDGELADFRVDYVIGGKRMQDDVTVFPDGRWQVLPVYFHVADRTWVDYTEAKQGPLSPEHPFYWTNARRMANHECLDCHTTALRVEYSPKARTWTTSFADGNVACEDCHGPGSRHADTQKAEDIVEPVDARAAGMSACARCHGPRRPLFSLLDPAHQFHPGDSYDELYDPIVVTMPDGGVSSDYFVDGKPKTSSFEYQAMLQAACYRKGGADCLTCHTAPHDKAHHKAELRDKPDALCATCHADIAKAPAAHSHHKTATCISCHMPPIVSGVGDHFADHSIDVPAPASWGCLAWAAWALVTDAPKEGVR